MFDVFFNKVSNVFTSKVSEIEKAKQMLFSNSVSNTLNSFGKDTISVKKIPMGEFANTQSPKDQILNLGKKYNVPFDGNFNTYQSKVIKEALIQKANQAGIPENVILGISGNESGWKMWSNIDSGKVVQGKNSTSSDWGAMQINDKAHPKAFPRAREDLEYNLDYAINLLVSQRKKIKGTLNLGFGDWDRTVASYNLGHNPSTSNSYRIANNYVSNVKKKSNLA